MESSHPPTPHIYHNTDLYAVFFVSSLTNQHVSKLGQADDLLQINKEIMRWFGFGNASGKILNTTMTALGIDPYSKFYLHVRFRAWEKIL